MKPYIAENESKKTRRAVVHGRQVWFYRRKKKRGGYVSPQPIWTEEFVLREEAVAAADRWAIEGKLGVRRVHRAMVDNPV